MTGRPRVWLVAVAALMAALYLYQNVGLEGALLLAGGFAVGTVAWRLSRRRVPVKGPGVRCLSCGEALAETARSCKYCGSARWTVN